jgi:gas vesicle protein
MTQRDGFTSGFIAGTLVGGILGGAIGALLASQRLSEMALDAESRKNADLPEANNNKRQRRQFKATASDKSIEMARRSLEDKIAQLNETIDEVRQTLGQVNGNQPEENAERISRSEDLTR